MTSRRNDFRTTEELIKLALTEEDGTEIMRSLTFLWRSPLCIDKLRGYQLKAGQQKKKAEGNWEPVRDE